MRKGFTLLELLLVVGIMMVIGVMSLGFYSRFIVQTEVDNTADKIVQNLRKAQYYSMVSRKSNTAAWGVSFSANVLKVFLTGSPALDENTQVNPNITITGLTSITFSRLRGLPSTTGTIEVYGQGTTRTILVNSEGNISR